MRIRHLIVVWTVVVLISVLIDGLFVNAAAKEATSRPSGLYVRILVDGKPFRGLLHIYGKDYARTPFVTEDGCTVPGADGPLDLVYINSTGERKAFAGTAHVDRGVGDVTVHAREVKQIPVTITIRDENGHALPDMRIKAIQSVNGQLAWATDITTNQHGEAIARCVPGAIYQVECSRTQLTGSILSEKFTVDQLPDSKFDFVAPSFEASTFRFRFIRKVGAERVHLEDIKSCEVVEFGLLRAVDGTFFIQLDADADAKQILAPGKACEVRLPDSVSKQYDFADGKGQLTIGKVGESGEIELVPRVRHRLNVQVTDAAKAPLAGWELSCRRVGETGWRASRGALEDLVPGKYEVTAWVPGYLASTQTVDSSAKTVLFELKAGPKAAFVVRGPDGKPLAGAPIKVYYASRELGPQQQRLRLDKDGAGSLQYDSANRPVAVIYAKGLAPFVLALEQEPKTYNIAVPQVPATKVMLIAGEAGLPKVEQLQRVRWVTTTPARLRIGETLFKDGAGEALLMPGEYVPIFAYSDMDGISPGDMGKVLVCKPVKISDSANSVQIVPDKVMKLAETIDGRN